MKSKLILLSLILLPFTTIGQTFEQFYATQQDKDIHRAQAAYSAYLSSTYTNYVLLTNKTFVIRSMATVPQDYVAVVRDPTFSVETNETYDAKPNFIMAAEQLYIKNLTDMGYSGAWTNMNSTFEEIGLDLLVKIDQTNDVALAETALRKKSVLESLYVSLTTYASAYGIKDLRLYPFGQSNILVGTSFRTYIAYEDENYFASEE